jgi:hypothetical protein
VVNVEVKQVDMPESMLRAMAKQAEAEREKRSKIIHVEGEFSTAQRLVDAAKLLATEPVGIQLRYLQTLTEIGVEKNTTIVFPLPLNILEGLSQVGRERATGSMLPKGRLFRGSLVTVPNREFRQRMPHSIFLAPLSI